MFQEYSNRPAIQVKRKEKIVFRLSYLKAIHGPWLNVVKEISSEKCMNSNYNINGKCTFEQIIFGTYSPNDILNNVDTSRSSVKYPSSNWRYQVSLTYLRAWISWIYMSAQPFSKSSVEHRKICYEMFILWWNVGSKRFLTTLLCLHVFDDYPLTWLENFVSNVKEKTQTIVGQFL